MPDPTTPTPTPAAPPKLTDTVAYSTDATGDPHPPVESTGTFQFLGPPSQPGDLGVLGPYRVTKLLGEGGMGYVFRAEDDALRRPVALKVMKPEVAARQMAKERFLREGRAAASLKSDHVTVIHFVGEANGVPFLAMEFLDGWTLEDWLKSRPTPQPAAIVRVARDTLKGLAAAHDKGMVHRDVKPANLWLEKPTGRVKVLDFGLARGTDGADQVTASGAIVGTPAYMSPEQARGLTVDARTDLFSLGVVLYRMVAGRSPFARGDTLATLSALALDDPPPLSGLPADVAAFIARLMAKDAAGRPASAKAALAELAAIEKRLREAAEPSTSKSVVVPELAAPAISPLEQAAGFIPAVPSQPQDGGDEPRRSPRMKRFVAAGLLGVVLAVAAGVIVIKITTKDGTVIEVPVPSGAKVEITERPTPPATKPTVPKAMPATFKNTLGMEFVKVPKGTGWLRGSEGKPGEQKVAFPDDFYLGKYEVTQEEWEKVTEENPSHFSRRGNGKDVVKEVKDDELKRFPVDQVSWDDCQMFLERLNKREKESGWVYRLPKADEWEYACRGGPCLNQLDSGFDFYFDKPSLELGQDQANFDSVRGRTCRVGLFKPNSLGLYDMHGNVWEWCQDWIPPAPENPNEGSRRVYRGGGWNYFSLFCRAAFRHAYTPSSQYHNLGFRVARVPAPQPNAAMFKNAIGMEFVKVPKGTGWLGGGGGKPGETKVEFAQEFYLGKFEVTQEEWEKVTGQNPSHFSRNGSGKDAVNGITDDDLKRFPVDWVSWDDCQAFCERMNKRENEPGWVYRLPTGAEWEYACRGGPLADRIDSGFDFYFEKPSLTLGKDQANFNSELKRTCKVGLYKPNALGLFDMHGNVWEWTEDEVPPDPNAPQKVSRREFRGGSWFFGFGDWRAANRGVAHPPSHRSHNLGLRLARVPVPQPNAATFKNALGMEFVKVPKGTGWLGGGGGKPGETKVEFAQDFYLGKYEVTQEEWEAVMGANPSGFSRGGAGKDAVKVIADADLKRFPVENVSWELSQEFVKKLNERAKEASWFYRLPTGAEWEYACRGGPLSDRIDSGFDFYLEKPSLTLGKDQANFDYVMKRTGKVGSYKPNALGLFDLHGNVWEWTEDEAPPDPKDPKSASRRVLRGGSWEFDIRGCRASHRDDSRRPSLWHDSLGLRLVRVPVAATSK